MAPAVWLQGSCLALGFQGRSYQLSGMRLASAWPGRRVLAFTLSASSHTAKLRAGGRLTGTLAPSSEPQPLHLQMGLSVTVSQPGRGSLLPILVDQGLPQVSPGTVNDCHS